MLGYLTLINKKYTMNRIMLFTTFMLSIQVFAQFAPQDSPFYLNGAHSVVSETLTDASPELLIFRPSSNANAPYPVFLFQPGANEPFQNNISVSSYNLYMEHLASYGYVVVVIDNTSGGPNNNLFSGVLTRLETLKANTGHWMHEYADMDNLVVGGHSNGGLNATQLILQQPQKVKGITYFASYPNPSDPFGFAGDDVSNYTGNVLLLLGDEDETTVPFSGSTNDVAIDAYDNFEVANCKTLILFEGVGHAGFGDYTHGSHTVGSLGRENVTALIRHFFVSFMDRTTKGNSISDAYFVQNHPNHVEVFQTTCVQLPTASLNPEVMSMNLFPNPTNDKLNIEFMNPVSGIIHIRDLSGRIVHSISVSNSNYISMYLNNLESGKYFLEFSDAQIKLIKTIIVQR
jgi:hypothetical protein